MLELTEQQWRALCAVDEHNFVATIRDDIVRSTPRLADDRTLLERLVKAFRDAKRIGIRQDKTLIEFLYFEAEAPGFYFNPPIANWMSKPVGTADERFEDLVAVLRKKVGERQEAR